MRNHQLNHWLTQSPEERNTAVAHHITHTSPQDREAFFAAGAARIKKDLHEDGHRAEKTADLLIFAAQSSPNPDHRALAARMKAQILLICFGQYDAAKSYYDEALQGYQASGNDLERAKTENTHIWLLALTDSHEEAFARGTWAMQTLAHLKKWDDHMATCNNLSSVYNLAGYTRKALDTLNQINSDYLKTGPIHHQISTYANRALYLQELGKYREAIQLMVDTITKTEQGNGGNIYIANLKHNLALTYIKLGNYTAALPLLDEASLIWISDGRYHDVALAKLVTSECLYQLRRFKDVLHTFDALRTLIAEHQVMPDKLFAFTNEARTYMALKQPEQAIQSLQTAKTLIHSSNPFVMTHFDLVEAEVLYTQQIWEDSLTLATRAATQFSENGHMFAAVTAYILIAKNAIAQQDRAQAEASLKQAADIAEAHNVPTLLYQIQTLKGMLHQHNAPQQALTAYQDAITQLERLQSNIMVEFRPSFMQDDQKKQVYEQVVHLLLDQDEVLQAWQYVERSKSRALLDLVGQRVHLDIKPRNAADEPLVTELNQLRERRNELGQQASDPEEAGEIAPVLAEAQAVEQKITAHWHTLLLRHADYGRAAALNHIPTTFDLPDLEADSAIIEYFPIDGRLSAFVLTPNPLGKATTVAHIELNCTLNQITALYRHLFLNIGLVARTPQAQNPNVSRNMRGVLQKLYQALIKPLIPHLEGATRWRIVPHDVLHYFPFEAFHDGEQYLVERTAVSYLPAVSIHPYSQPHPQNETAGNLVIGHSYRGRLPHTLVESQQLATLCQAGLMQEEAVTLQALTAAMPHKKLIHIATHGEFRADNPLFSGLYVEDGWLTTLDIFNLELHASLVTLSACYTGRSVISGGDELLGIARAFLTAGASTLLLSQWAVEDQSTALLMHEFYRLLQQGKPKDIALQQAQLALIRGQLTQPAHKYQHPFFWSPFFLIGHNGRL